jgi:hypothetical protein
MQNWGALACTYDTTWNSSKYLNALQIYPLRHPPKSQHRKLFIFYL